MKQLKLRFTNWGKWGTKIWINLLQEFLSTQSVSRYHCINDYAILPPRWVFLDIYFLFLFFFLVVSHFCFALHSLKKVHLSGPMIAGIFRCGRGIRAGLQAVAILHVGSYSFCFPPIHGYRQVWDSAKTTFNPIVIRQTASLCMWQFFWVALYLDLPLLCLKVNAGAVLLLLLNFVSQARI